MPHPDRKDRRTGEVRIAGGFVAVLLALNQIGAVHALQRPLEKSPNPTAGHSDQAPTKQRAPRPHGGPRIPAPDMVEKSKQPAPVKIKTAQSIRGFVRGSDVHNLYSSEKVGPKKVNVVVTQPEVNQPAHVFAGVSRGNGLTPIKVMAASIQLHPEVRTIKERDKEKMKVIDGVVKILSQMGLKDDISSIRQMLRLETPTQSILEYAQKVVSEKMIRFVSKASTDDLNKISQFDFSGTPLAKITEDIKFSSDQKAGIQLLSEEVANSINEYKGIDFPDFLKKLSQQIVDFEKNVAPGILTNGFIPTLLITLTQASPTIAESLKKKKKLANLALLLTDIIVLTACIAQVIAPLVTAIPSAAPQATAEPSPTPATIVGTPSIESQATVIAPSNPSMESLYVDLNFGDVAGQPFGAIPAPNVTGNNPNYILPDGQSESRHNFYYRTDDPKALRGFGLDQSYLIDVFNANTDKGGLTGHLPDGTEVKFVNGFWQYNKDGQNYYLLSNAANLSGRLLGYPLLVVDKASGKQLFFGLVDQNGVLLKGSEFDPAFLSVAELAKNLGYTGDQSLIGSFQYDQYGNIVVLDTQGNRLSVFPYLDPFSPSLLTPIPTLAPTPEGEPLWNMDQPLPPLNSQNAEFESNPQSDGAIHFTVEGQPYAIEIPRPEVIDGAGVPIAGEGEITVKLYPPPSDAQSKQTPPKVTFVDKSGGEMAWYDVVTGQWTKRYETLFVRDSWPEFPQISWIEGSLGFEKYEKGDTGSEYLDDFLLTVSGRVKRVYAEKVWYPAEKRFGELTWASITYDKDGQKTLETILFTDTEYRVIPGNFQGVQIVEKLDDYSSFIPQSLLNQNQAILEAVKSSAFVEMRLGFAKDSYKGRPLNQEALSKYGFRTLIRRLFLEGKYWDEQRGLARTMIGGNLDDPKLKDLDGKLQGYSPLESGVRIGFDKLWIFVPNSGN